MFVSCLGVGSGLQEPHFFRSSTARGDLLCQQKKSPEFDFKSVKTKAKTVIPFPPVPSLKLLFSCWLGPAKVAVTPELGNAGQLCQPPIDHSGSSAG